MKIGMVKVKQAPMHTATLKPKEQDPPRPPAPIMRGIQTGEQSETTRAVLRSKATPDELRQLEATIGARLAKEVSIWLRCDSARCGYVGAWLESAKDMACAFCNRHGEKAGGHMRPMSAAAVAEYKRAMAAADAEANRRAHAAALVARNKERESAGLPALTPEQHDSELRHSLKSLRESERLMGETYAQNERERRAKVMK